MIVYRIAMRPYIDLSGNGGLYHSGRWHPKGIRIIYTSGNLETCLLEIAANNYLATARKIGMVMRITIPDNSILPIEESGLMPEEFQLDNSWRSSPEKRAITQNIGLQFTKSRMSLALCVPSIVIDSPTAVNYLLNPEHPDMSEVSFESYALSFDQRLKE